MVGVFVQIFSDIWRNKYSRFALIIFLLLLFIGSILLLHMKIYNFFYYGLSGKSFSAPRTYTNQDYGFAEDEKRSISLFKKGIGKLVDEVVDLYEIKGIDTDFLKEPEHNGQWYDYYNPETTETVLNFFKDLELFCQPYISDGTIAGELEFQKKLTQRTPAGGKHHKGAIVYPITESNYIDLMNYLVELDSDYFYPALEKKPDSQTILKLREQILRSVCRTHNISLQYQRAIAYIEYKTEKKIFQNSKDNEPRDILTEQVFRALTENSYYKSLLKEHFRHSFFETADLRAKVTQSFNYYTLTADPQYLLEYVITLKEKSKISGKNLNHEITKILLDIKNKTVTRNPVYILAVAEAAYRAGDKELSKKYLRMILNNDKIEGYEKFEARRLDFAINLVEKAY